MSKASEEHRATSWTVPVPSTLERSLERLLDAKTASDIEFLVSFGNGFKVEIYANEHPPPPHFHVKYKNEENSFRISDARPLHADGLDRHFRNIKKWHALNKTRLVEVWNSTRPAECPVGKISVPIDTKPADA